MQGPSVNDVGLILKGMGGPKENEEDEEFLNEIKEDLTNLFNSMLYKQPLYDKGLILTNDDHEIKSHYVDHDLFQN